MNRRSAAWIFVWVIIAAVVALILNAAYELRDQYAAQQQATDAMVATMRGRR